MTSAQHLEQIFGVSFLEQPDITALRQFHANNTFCENGDGAIIGVCACENDFEAIQLPGTTFQQLEYLNLSDNQQLKHLTIEGALPALKHLDISDSKLEALTLPAHFEALEWLDISRNELTTLTIEGNLPCLSYLDISDNQIKTLSIPDGRQLKYLYAQKNQLTEFSISPSAVTLQIIHLKENQLDSLPLSLLSLTSLDALYVYGNPLSSIPQENIAEGEGESSLENIRNYLLSITQDEAIDNDEIKLVLLGNSTSGKSSLLRYMIKKVYDEQLSSTHGIQNKLWPLNNGAFKVNVWDFGGQEFYHATHRLFLSNNAVTLLLFDQATNFQGEQPTKIKLYEAGELVEREIPLQHFPFSYWLDSLQHFCQQQQPESTVLIQTKMDEADTTTIRIPDSDKKKYQLLEDHIFRLSVKGAHDKIPRHVRNFESFAEDLQDILHRAKSSYQISKKWLAIKEALRTAGQQQVMLTYPAYKDICERIRPGISQTQGEGKKSVLDTLTNYLHGISVILYYPDITALKDIVFINPQWITNIIYKVLDYEVKKKEGKFDRPHIEQIIRKDKLADDLGADQLIALMKEFELIFQVKNSPDNFIAPQYLPKENPEKESKSYRKVRNKCDKSAFTIRYPVFMPRSVMTRLICRYGNLSEDLFWRNGIVFEKGKVTIHLECDQAYQIKVDMDVLDPEAAGTLFSDIQEINKRHPNIEVSVNGEDFVKIAHLKEHPPANLQIQATNGKWLDAEDFQIILHDHGMKSNFAPPAYNPIDMDEIQQLVSNDQLKKALNLLKQMVPADKANDVTLVQRQLNDLDKQRIFGVLSNNEENITRNKIAARILALAASLKNDLQNRSKRELGKDRDLTGKYYSGSEKSRPPKSPTKIYFSYAWGDPEEIGESREKIVDQLYNSLKADGFQVLRDKIDLEYGGPISEFMQELGRGDLIVVFISDKYFKSPNCMFELNEINRNSKLEKELFRKRILPIPVERIPLNDLKLLKKYKEHWKQKEKEWKAFMTEEIDEDSASESHFKKLKSIRTIKLNFSELTAWLDDINTSTIDLLTDNNFELVKKAIKNRLEQLKDHQ